MKPEILNEAAHPSRYLLTRFHAGDLEEQDRVEMLEHVSACSTCSEYVQDLEKTKTSFQLAHDRKVFLASVQARYRQTEAAITDNWSWWGRKIRPLAMGFSAAAVIVVLVVVLARISKHEQPGERIKGSEIELGYFVMGKQGPEIAPHNHILHPGDRIQFRLTAPAGGYVNIVGVDEKGTVTVYFPRPNHKPQAFPGGAGRPVPGSVILDDTLGRERVFVLFCEKPMSREELRHQLAKLSKIPELLLERDTLPVSCQQSSIVLYKSAGER